MRQEPVAQWQQKIGDRALRTAFFNSIGGLLHWPQVVWQGAVIQDRPSHLE